MYNVVGDCSQDEEDEAKPVTMKFARQETEEAKARRLRSFGYLQKKREEESWINISYHDINVSKLFLFDIRGPSWL